MLAVEVRGLVKNYRGPFERAATAALRGVDLEIEKGTAYGLIGPNGAGKTTFIKALLGVVRPTAGSIRLLGGCAEDPAVRPRRVFTGATSQFRLSGQYFNRLTATPIKRSGSEDLSQ